MTNYAEALALAAREDRPVLLYFTGSDWCPPCKTLDEDLFQKPAFQAFAKENLVLVLLDFPPSRGLSPALLEQNRALEMKYGVQGFPTLILLSSGGKEIGREMGNLPGGPAAFVKWFNAATK